ncbi:hypothetical protein PG990_002817 [Apiospora arundinis]
MVDSASPPLPAPVNPSDLGAGPLLMGITWAFSGLAVIAVAARFWVRIAVTKLLGGDDWLMLLAMVLNLVCQACITLSFQSGLGKHQWDLIPDEMVNQLKWIWISIVPGVMSSIIARISIAMLIIRIFGSKKWLKWFVIIATVLQGASNIAVIVIVMTQATPVEGLWNTMIPANRRDPSVLTNATYVGGALFAFGDLTYVLLPVMVVWKLHMPLQRKLGLCILLALSLVTMGVAITKAVYSKTAENRSDDALYYSSIGVLWAILEQTMVIILGCAPPLSSIAKIKLPGVPYITASLRRLINSRDGSSRGSSTKLDETGRKGQTGGYGAYYELGNTGKTQSQVQAGQAGSAFESASDRRVDTGRIRRTDRYMVTSDRDIAEPV